jgi:acetyltransferase-like isoleucine patch superfamily enzyme
MRLPEPLRLIRSRLAGSIGIVLRTVSPVTLRVGRFGYECRARALLRGEVAPGVQFVGPIHVEGAGKVNIGAETRVGRQVFFETHGDAAIEIGERVTINDGCVIVAYDHIRIESHTMIGEYASIRDANHGMRRDAYVHDQPHEAAAVHIGEGAWIGRGALVGKGAQIGAGAVIGGNSVVRGEVPENAIAVGAPARVIRERQP